MNYKFVLLFCFLLFSCQNDKKTSEGVASGNNTKSANRAIHHNHTTIQDDNVRDYKGVRVKNKNSEKMKKNDYIGRANLEVKGLIEIPAEVKPNITEKENVIEVIWPESIDPEAPPFPRAGYYALVRFEKESGKVLEVLVAP